MRDRPAIPWLISGPNLAHPVNVGLRAWFLGAPGYAAGTRWFDATGKYSVNLTGFAARAWYPSSRGREALQLDGSASYVPMPFGSVVGSTKNFTYACWINTTSTVAGGTFIGEGNSSTPTTLIQVRQDSVTASVPGFQLRDDFSTIFNLIGTRTINDGLWHHVVAIYTGNTMALYVDGFADGTLAAATGSFTLNQATFGNLSRTTNTNFWAGSLDDVRIYPRALTTAEVQALYRESLAGYPEALLYWRPSPLVLKSAGLINSSVAHAPGAFTVAGAAAGRGATRRLQAGTGSFALAGNASSTTRGSVDYFLPRAWFGIWWDGQWTNRNAPASFHLAAARGQFSVAGTAAGLIAPRRLIVAPGTFAVSGGTAAEVTSRRLVAATGTFTVTASASGEVTGRRLTAAAGSFVVAGSASSKLATRRLTASTGTFTVTASPASLPTTHRLTAGTGTFTLAGSAATLRSAHRLFAAPGAFTVAGQPVSSGASTRRGACAPRSTGWRWRWRTRARCWRPCGGGSE